MRTLAPVEAELAAEARQARMETRHGGNPNYAGLRAALERASHTQLAWARSATSWWRG